MADSALDHFDIRILGILQSAGRTTNAELAERVGLSPSPCLRRVRALEARGTIRGYAALINPEAVGLTVTAFVRVRLGGQDDQHLALFEENIAGFPEVMDCYLMTGECDYQLRVIVASLSDFEQFLRQKLTKVPGVSEVTTSFALRPIVSRTEIALS